MTMTTTTTTTASSIAVKASSKLSSNDKILVEALAGARAPTHRRADAPRIETKMMLTRGKD
jgi:peroxiredoxin